MKMKMKIWKKSRQVEQGIYLRPNGTTKNFAYDYTCGSHFEVVVNWQDKPATMRFNGHVGCECCSPRNTLASDLIEHPGFVVRGLVQIVTGARPLYKMTVWATEEEVLDRIAKIGLGERPLVQEHGYRVLKTDIYAANENDLFAIKMCL